MEEEEDDDDDDDVVILGTRTSRPTGGRSSAAGRGVRGAAYGSLRPLTSEHLGGRKGRGKYPGLWDKHSPSVCRFSLSYVRAPTAWAHSDH